MKFSIKRNDLRNENNFRVILQLIDGSRNPVSVRRNNLIRHDGDIVRIGSLDSRIRSTPKTDYPAWDERLEREMARASPLNDLPIDIIFTLDAPKYQNHIN